MVFGQCTIIATTKFNLTLAIDSIEYNGLSSEKGLFIFYPGPPRGRAPVC